VRKLQPVQIEIERVEGTIHECVTDVVTAAPEQGEELWVRANRILRRWSSTAPKGRSYHKCDFTVTFEDGSTYGGRFDLHHYTDEVANLRDHVHQYLTFVAGDRRPAWMTDSHWESALRMNEENRGAAKEFLSGYNIAPHY